MKNILLCFILVSVFAGKSFAQFDWKNTGGPFGSGSSIIFSNDQYAFIPENDFLFRSSDGSHWEGLEHSVSNSLGIYYDTIVNVLWDKSLNLFRFQISYDNGENWLIKSLSDEITEYGDIVMCSHGIYFAQGQEGKIFRTIDLGDTWDLLTAPDTFEILKVFENRLYISGDSLLWRTDQNGENWSNITPPLPHPYPFFTRPNDFVALDSHILVAADDSLFLSHNNGQSWNVIYAYSTNEGDKMTIAGSYIYLNTIGALIRSNDFGIHWDTLITHFYPHAISFCGLGDILLMSTYDRGIFKFDESVGQMMESSASLTKGVIYDLSIGVDKIWAACGNGVFAYDIPTATWSNKMDLPNPDYEYRFASANDQGWIITAENNAEQFYISENGGLTWDTVKTDFEIPELQLLGESIFVFYNRVYRSLDKGQHWDTLDFSIVGNEIIPFKDKMYLLGPGLLYYSSDNGATWNSMDIPLYPLKVFAFADKMYALASNLIDQTDLFISEDAIHWTHADQGLPDIDPFTFYYYYHPLFFRDAIYDYAFLGSEGHYTSSDGALSWSPLETTQTGNDYLVHDNIIYLGGEGMYSSIIENPYITSVQEHPEKSFTLFNISPNPVSTEIQILFEDGFSPIGTVQIFSTDGILLKSILTDGISQSLNIPIDEFPNGLFYVMFKGKQNVDFKSFLKLN